MIAFWTSLSGNARFSAIACLITAVLGLLSMGLLGALLYYPVAIFFRAYPTLNSWTGDWVWPATIGVGMGWSLGFPLASLAWHGMARLTDAPMALYAVYVLVLWLWAAVLWGFTIHSNL